MKNSDLKFSIIATDIVLFSYIKEQLCVKLIDCRNVKDFPNMKCLPGGLIGINETSEQSSIRILKEKASIVSVDFIDQLKTYSKIDRDPRGRVLAVAYIAIICFKDINQRDLQDFAIVKDVSKLAYDHNEILKDAVIRLKELAVTTNILFKLLASEFTVAEVKNIYEKITGNKTDKRNFLKKLKLAKALKDTKKKKIEGSHRPATIFTHTFKEVVRKNFF